MGRQVKSLITALNKSFAELEDNGWGVGSPKTMSVACCQSCSWHNFSDDIENVAFYHEQDLDRYRETIRDNKEKEERNHYIEVYEQDRELDTLFEPSIYLAHRGDTNQLVNILVKNRIVVNWNGSPEQRMRLEMAQPNKQGVLVGLSESA